MSELRGAFIGRETELDLLGRLVQRTAAGEGGVALVTGEPGIGKSRVLGEVAATAKSNGFAVAWGRAWELGSAPTYWPWIEVLRTLIAREKSRDEATDHLTRLLPELEGQVAVSPQAPNRDAFQLCDAVMSYLEAASWNQPLLILLDDLHAADASSLELAEFVARKLSATRISILGSHRDVEARRTPEIEAPLARLARRGDVLALRRLALGEVELLVQDATGRLDKEAARMIHGASEGNPLFIQELIRLIGATTARPTGVPSGVRAIIRERLRLLAPATVALLQAAAVVGREFEVGVAAGVAGVTESALSEAALDATGAELLSEVAVGRYRFSHALVAETLAEDLSGAIRTRLHRRVAELLEERHAEDPTPPFERIAHHYLKAGPEVTARAADAAERAAALAMRRLAFADAALLYENALAAHTQGAPADAVRRAALLIAQAEAWARAGNRARAEACSSTAAELARSSKDGAMLARAALALGAEVTVGQRDVPLVRLLDEALALMAPADDPLRAEVMARLASARQPESDPEQPIALAREAIAMARRVGDADVELRVLHSAMGALVDFAPAAERAALNAEVAQLAARAGDRPRGLRALMRLAFDSLELVDLRGFERAVGEYQSLASEVGQPRFEGVALMFHSMRANWEGRFADADQLEAEARRLYDGEGALPLAPMRDLGKAVLHDDAALYEQTVERLFRIFPQDRAFHSAFYVRIAIQKGQLDEAAELVRGLETTDFAAFRIDIHALEVGADVAWRLRHRGLAETLYPLLLPNSGRPFLVTGIAYSLHGVVDHALMRLAAVLGQWDDVERHAQTALDVCARLSASPIAAAVRRDKALLLAERKGVGAKEPTPAVESITPRGMGLELRREGEYWTVSGFGELCRIQDNRGMHMLAQLIESSGREVHVLDLSGALAPVDGGDAGEMIDREARLAYEERLSELTEELQEAEQWNDAGRRERLEAELEMLRAELGRAVGLGGRARRSASAVERARINVRRRLTLALQRIEHSSPALGANIRARLRTGTYCAYEPAAKS